MSDKDKSGIGADVELSAEPLKEVTPDGEQAVVEPENAETPTDGSAVAGDASLDDVKDVKDVKDAIDSSEKAAESGPEDDDPQLPASGSEDARKPSRIKGLLKGILWLLIILIALGGAGGSGWLWWERYQGVDPATLYIRDLSVRLQQQELSLQRSVAQGTELAGQFAQLERELLTANNERDANGLRLARELAELRDARPTVDRDWRLAEVEYLMQIANLRLNMERDVAGALRLLKAADGLLSDLDDFSLLEVRAAAARDIAALEAVPGLDVDGLFLRLQALKENIEHLPIAQARSGLPASPSGPSSDAAVPEPAIGWQILDRLLGTVSVRTDLDAPLAPMISAQESWYLEQNLRLMLEQAQISLLRTREGLFRQSLSSAAAWTRLWFEVDAPAVAALLRSLDDLAQVQLVDDLPDISGSLNELRRARGIPTDASL